MRRIVVVAVLLVAVLAAPAGRVEAGGGRFAEIREVLEAREDALRDGDEAAFMASVDSADPAFVERQRLLFRGYRNLGADGYRLEIGEALPELTTRAEIRRYGRRSRPTVLHVEERYVLPGYDLEPVVEELFITFLHRQGGWKLASDTDLEDAGVESSRKLWEFGPVETQTSEHFVFVSHPELSGVAPSILAAAERGLATVEETWPLPWHERVVILAPTTTEELARIIQATFDLDVFVAFASSEVDRAEDWDLVGHRIFLHWERFSRHSDAGREQILAHELLHIATRDITGPFVPAFVDEGWAEWVAGSTATSVLAGRVQSGEFDRRLPRDFEFLTGSDLDIINSYQESTSAALRAVDRFGDQRVARMYRVLGRARLAPGTWRYHVDRAMRAVFGSGFRDFEEDWAGWIQESLG